MAVGQREQPPPVLRRSDPAGRIVGRANVDQLRARPHRVGDGVPVRREASRGVGVDAVGLGAGQQRGPLVDLVERVGHHDGRAGAAAVDDGLREREQRLAAAQHRQHRGRGIERRQAMAADEPAGNGFAQRGGADRRGIIRQSAEAGDERVEDELRRRVPGLADRQVDRRERGVRHHAGKQRPQPLEGVGVQTRESGIHGGGQVGSDARRL